MQRSDASWGKLWQTISNFADANEIELKKPRTNKRQAHRANEGNELNLSVADYYRINVYIPFVDHVIIELDNRFSSDHGGLLTEELLVPVNLNKLSEETEKSIVDFYGKYLNLVENIGFQFEIAKWKKSFENTADEDKPGTMEASLAQCNPQSFPVLNKIFRILMTVPVGSVACERSFSALRRLKLWTRSTMKEDRLSRLAMLMIHKNSNHTPQPKDIYAMKANWR